MTFKITISFFLFCFFSGNSFAQKEFEFDPVASKVIPKYLGEVILVKGNVTAKKKGADRKIKLKMGTKVWPQDVVETKGRSFLKVLMVDDTYLTLGPKSVMDFKKFKFKAKNDRIMDVNLLRGKMRMHFRKKAKEGDLRVHVGEVSMGIRGTEIMGNAFITKAGTKVSQVALLRGSVMAEFPNGSSKLLSPGDHSVTTLRLNGQQDNKVAPMDKEQVMKYLSLQADPSKDFKPLLDFYKALDEMVIDRTSGNRVDPESNTEDSMEDDGGWPAPKPKKQNWRNSLQKLNNRLQENNAD
ncbi:MAG: hypothetical protein CME70_22205 [Halobacteriovorax sp.]|nr:hypothetical protein [Halobacteriovorax sp.]|tara:strand:- start:131850 stop:132740 length:891 start_codon:yes stop_codon:yes gene_type:complete